MGHKLILVPQAAHLHKDIKLRIEALQRDCHGLGLSHIPESDVCGIGSAESRNPLRKWAVYVTEVNIATTSLTIPNTADISVECHIGDVRPFQHETDKLPDLFVADDNHMPIQISRGLSFFNHRISPKPNSQFTADLHHQRGQNHTECNRKHPNS